MGFFNCGHPRSPENSRPSGRHSRCRTCDNAARRERSKNRVRIRTSKPAGQCSTCESNIYRRNKSGRCAPCILRDPAEQKKRQEALRARFNHDPALKKSYTDRLRLATSTPEHAERSRRLMTENKVWEYSGPVVAGSERALKIGRSGSATKMAWCPPHLHAAYRELMQVSGIRADEARTMILEQNELEMARWRSKQGIVITGADLPALQSLAGHISPARRVLERAAQVFSVTVDEIKGSSRQQMYVRPRCAIAHVLHGHGWSTPRISTFLGKGDHTTCRNWLMRAEQMMSDEAFDCAIEELEDAYGLQLPEALAA